MHINNRYVLERAQASGGPILDYGCGGGETVKAGLAAGLDIYGADIFQVHNAERLASVSPLLDKQVFRIEDGRLPFPDATFATVVSNQVFEHVGDLDSVLGEIVRVLKPGGVLLTLFPSKEVWFEGHCRIFFAHWLVGRPWLFKPYMTLAHFLGFGIYREGKTRREWVDGFADYLKRYTAYRTMPELRALFAKHGLKIEHAEADYMRFRWGRSIMPVSLYRRRAGLVLRAHAA